MSIFDIYKIGIGPSSSHTMGPMLAASRFLMSSNNSFHNIHSIEVELFGSLAATGLGHGTHKALLAGLTGLQPDSCNPEQIQEIYDRVEKNREICLLEKKTINFHPVEDIIFNDKSNDHAFSNTLTIRAFDKNNCLISEQTYYSVGGGKLLTPETITQGESNPKVPYPFENFASLSDICRKEKLTIAQLVMANECAIRSTKQVREHLAKVWTTMEDCIHRGCHQQGYLPGHLKVKKRAGEIYRNLKNNLPKSGDPLAVMDWVNLYALAVNEENASGSIVVTAPTNGAAGIVPAVLKYYKTFYKDTSLKATENFLLTSTAIAMLYAKNASLSGAEVGCQGEVGVACSMAAAGLISVCGGSTKQIGQAAEIGMEHNLGLTCDPIGGMVQIPCIERNAMGAVKAINAARIAQQGSGHHYVSLDTIIKVMMETGKDMQAKYKETSRGGLAVNVVEC